MYQIILVINVLNVTCCTQIIYVYIYLAGYKTLHYVINGTKLIIDLKFALNNVPRWQQYYGVIKDGFPSIKPPHHKTYYTIININLHYIYDLPIREVPTVRIIIYWREFTAMVVEIFSYFIHSNCLHGVFFPKSGFWWIHTPTTNPHLLYC